jgi:hypothetical protein
MVTTLLRAVSPRLFPTALLSLLAALPLAGCRNTPTNPFLSADALAEAESGDPHVSGGDPLAESLARLKNRRDQFQDSAAATAEAAKGLGNEAQAVAQDTISETRQALGESLDEAEGRGKQLAYDAAAGAQETVRQASTNAQLDAIASLEDMPLEQAGPLLMVAISKGTPTTQRAAAEQLSRRWPAAASLPSDLAAERRAAAMAELQRRWAEQYGQIDDAVMSAKAEAARVVDGASQVVDDARGVVESAQQQVQDVQQLAVAYREADLPASARQQLAKSLESLSASADANVRVRAAQAMGDTGDPAFLPALLSMLNDQPQVQASTLASLEKVTGRDIAARADGKPVSDEEKVRAWQLWYREQQDAAGK